MRVVALVSGGKDSCYNMLQCVSAGHDIVALANLHPPTKCTDELDSYMYQTVGHSTISMYAEAMDLPLYRASIKGAACCSSKVYSPTEGDEVEDLYRLLSKVQDDVDFEGVSTGAILSDYQRVRVENVCARLGVTSLSYLWRRDQSELLQEMISCQIEAVLIKVATLGLEPNKHLGQTLQQMRPHMEAMSVKCGLNVCGEGGEYETFTLDCPLFKKRIVIDEQEVVMHSDDAFAPVAYLCFTRAHLEDKQLGELTQAQRIQGLPLPFSTGPTLADEPSPSPTDSRAQPPAIDGSSGDQAPPLVESAGRAWIGPITGRPGNNRSAMQNAMETLRDVLSDHDLKFSDLVSVNLYLDSMSRYSVINSEYVRHFGTNPPVRACLAARLPPRVHVLLEAAAWRDTAGLRRTMHVQSVSHWAPANIGPYSQAVQCDDMLHVAGMIGLDPGSMRLVRGGENQARLALRHVQRVIEAAVPTARPDWIVQTVCFVTDPSLVAPSAALLTSLTTSSLTCHVVVPGLPRGASVEWQVWAHAANSHFQSRESQMALDGASLSVSARWCAEHHVCAATVYCAGTGAAQLTACLRATIGCLRGRAGRAAACHLRIFYSRDISEEAMSEAVQKVRDPTCSVSAVPVISVGDGTHQMAVVGQAFAPDREKVD